MKRWIAVVIWIAACGGGAAHVAPDGGGDGPSAVREVTLDPPPPGQGIQLEMELFDVPAGQERYRCRMLKFPLPDRTFVKKFEVRYTTGSHHFNLYKTTSSTFPDEYIDCPAPADFTVFAPLVAAQEPDTSWEMPAGSGFMIDGNVQLMMQAHYANATDQPIRARVLVNLWTVPEPEVTNWVIPVFVVNQGIQIPSHIEAWSTAMNCTFPLASKVLAMQGHFHSRGREFKVNRFEATTGVGAEVYAMTDYENPPFKMFGPDEGAFSVGTGFRFTCTFANDTDRTITWGPSAVTNEHCNLILYYSPGPTDGVSVSCVELTGEW